MYINVVDLEGILGTEPGCFVGTYYFKAIPRIGEEVGLTGKNLMMEIFTVKKVLHAVNNTDDELKRLPEVALCVGKRYD